MYRLQVRSHKVGISPRHLKRGVSEHFLQMEHAPAASDVVHCEGVPECVECARGRLESETVTMIFHSAQHHPSSGFGFIPCRQQEVVRLALKVGDVAEHCPAQLKGKRHNALLAPLAV